MVDKLMGTKVGLVLKIICKFQMGQLQDQELRRSRKQCKDWYNSLETSLSRAEDGLERTKFSDHPRDTNDRRVQYKLWPIIMIM